MLSVELSQVCGSVQGLVPTGAGSGAGGPCSMLGIPPFGAPVLLARKSPKALQHPNLLDKTCQAYDLVSKSAVCFEIWGASKLTGIEA